jgi:hypothetical protein
MRLAHRIGDHAAVLDDGRIRSEAGAEALLSANAGVTPTRSKPMLQAIVFIRLIGQLQVVSEAYCRTKSADLHERNSLCQLLT